MKLSTLLVAVLLAFLGMAQRDNAKHFSQNADT